MEREIQVAGLKSLLHCLKTALQRAQERRRAPSLIPLLLAAAALLIAMPTSAVSVGANDFPSYTLVDDFEGIIGPNEHLPFNSGAIESFKIPTLTYRAEDSPVLNALALSSINACHDRTCLQTRAIETTLNLYLDDPAHIVGFYVGMVLDWNYTIEFLDMDSSVLASMNLVGAAGDYEFVGWQSDSSNIARVSVLNHTGGIARIDDVHVPEVNAGATTLLALGILAWRAPAAFRRRTSPRAHSPRR